MHPQICLFAKFHRKTKMPKFGTKNALFGYFWARILKNIVIFEISTLKFVKNESLTHTVNFGIGFAFSEGPGPGSLYKVCCLTIVVANFCSHKQV